MKKNNPYRFIAYLGISLIIMSIVLMFIMPHKVHRLPHGFITPVLAFEFAQTSYDIYGIFYDEAGKISRDTVASMDLGNILDFIYMTQYSLFLLLFSLITFRITKKYILFLPALLSLMALAGDVFENIQLMGITSMLENGEYQQQLFYLHYFTWFKWASLSLIFLMIPLFIYKKGIFSAITLTMGLIVFILGAISFFHRSFFNELFSLSIAVMFLLLIIYSFAYKNGTNKY